MRGNFKKPYSLKNENAIRNFIKLQEEAVKQNKKVPFTLKQFTDSLFGRKQDSTKNKRLLYSLFARAAAQASINQQNGGSSK